MYELSNGYIYIVLFDDGLVKVGRSFSHPSPRYSSHAHIAALRNTKIKTTWDIKVSSPKMEESRLINYCLSNCTESIGREWFAGVDFENLVNFAGSGIFVADESVINKMRSDRDESIKRGAEKLVERIRCRLSDDSIPSHAYAFATLLEGLIVDDGVSGPMFEKGPHGNSLLWLNALIAFGVEDEFWTRQVFSDAITDPFVAIKSVFESADAVKASGYAHNNLGVH